MHILRKDIYMTFTAFDFDASNIRLIGNLCILLNTIAWGFLLVIFLANSINQIIDGKTG